MPGTGKEEATDLEDGQDDVWGRRRNPHNFPGRFDPFEQGKVQDDEYTEDTGHNFWPQRAQRVKTFTVMNFQYFPPVS